MNWAYDIGYMYGARPMFSPYLYGRRSVCPPPPTPWGGYGFIPFYAHRPWGPNPELINSIRLTQQFMGLAYLYNTVNYQEKYYCKQYYQDYSLNRYSYSRYNCNPFRYSDYSYSYTPKRSYDCNCKKTKETTETPKSETSKKITANRISGEIDESKNIFLGRTVTSKFGMRPLNGKTGMHKGIDLGYAEGENVYSFTDGKVTLVRQQKDKNGKLTGYGNYIDITDKNGVKHRYAHANKIIAKVGQEVKAGDLIMLAGSTGTSTGSHVHYETRVHDEPVNPFETWA